MQNNLPQQKANQPFLLKARSGEGPKERIIKGHKETYGYDGYVHYPDCGDGFTSVYRSQTNQIA